MYNNITAVGHLTNDPESFVTSGGKTKCTVRLCISDSNAKEKTFINCEFWDKQAEVCMQYLKSGREILINGELATNSWSDKEGNKRSTVFIRGSSFKFLSSGQKKDAAGNESPAPTTRGSSKPASSPQAEPDMDDDIPF